MRTARIPRSLDELKPGETASVIAEVRGSTLLRTRKMPIFELTVGQGRLALKCIWFNAGYLDGKFHAGQTVAVIRAGRAVALQQQLQNDSAAVRAAARRLRRRRDAAAGSGAHHAGLRVAGRRAAGLALAAEGDLPPARRDARRGAGVPAARNARSGSTCRTARRRCARRIFRPKERSFAQLQASATPAHRRLIFEELFFLELGLELKRRRMRERAGIGFATTDKVREAIREVLPFHPTAAQKRALGEIVADMRSPSPMRRLLQGDVGSGKTIVALQAMLVAMENGYQAALMAPTEILATQHFLAVRKLLERSSRRYRIVLLTGSLSEDRKRSTRGLINRGEAQLVIGTHALIEEKVEFDRLGLVVVDEQHRFGVMQRFKLMKKPRPDGTEGAEPDVLVMTATPIPRTLALSLYGDLDVSVLDELPPGRTPIVTRRVPGEMAEEVWDFVRKQVAKGRQAYIVYPVIEGSKEDQPELDFSHDDPEMGIEAISQVSKARPGAPASGKKGKTAELFPKIATGSQSGREIRPEIRRGDAREAAPGAAGRPARGLVARAAGRR